MWLKFSNSPQATTGLVATLGNFDGLHLGHQSLLSQVKKEAVNQNRNSALITFSPHPAKVFTANAPKRLTSFRQLAKLVYSKGINNLISIRFTTELAKMEAEQFVEQILFGRYDVKHLIIGPFATIGKDRKGTPEWIVEYFQSRGRQVTVQEPFALGETRVSSNQIRALISVGEIELANKLLGRPYTISARVVRGDRIGSSLGFPTANLSISDYVKPAYGVYLGQTQVEGLSYNSLSNFGVRPTFGGRKEVLETYLLDYKGQDFYGQRIELGLLQKIRDERQFSSSTELCHQIKVDIENAREIIEKRS